MPTTQQEGLMSTVTQIERTSEVENSEAPSTLGRRAQLIRSNVLASLGHPVHLLRVAVLPLWGDKFRVNVWTGEHGVGNLIPHSYFVTADERGTVLRAEPPIERLH
jgi:hypothetical protein